MLELLLLGGLAAGVFAGNRYAKTRDQEERGDFPAEGIGLTYAIIGALWPITAIFFANRLPFRWIASFVVVAVAFWVLAFEVYQKGEWGWYAVFGFLTVLLAGYINEVGLTSRKK